MADAPVMVVTGARKGLGRYLAEHFLEQGWRVLGCSRAPSDLEHPAYRHVCADVTDEAATRALFTELRQTWGGLDALVNNAGVAAMNHALLTPMKTARHLMEVNALGTFLFCREAAKLMSAQRRGRIVNLASVATPLHLEGEAAYAASKAAVVSLTEVLAHELGPNGITVNAVGPGPMRTDLVRGVPDEKLEALVARQAIRRFCEPQDVAHVVEFLVDEKCDFVTGQVIYLGGAP